MHVAAPRFAPGFYYVTVIDPSTNRRALLRGPWPTHIGALASVARVRAEAEAVDPWAAFYAFGTARSETDAGPGVLGPALEAAR